MSLIVAEPPLGQKKNSLMSHFGLARVSVWSNGSGGLTARSIPLAPGRVGP